MVKIDESFKRYFRNKTIVKDLMNALYFDGKQRIQEKDITEENIESVSEILQRRYRDLLFKITFPDNTQQHVYLIGLEAQSSVDYFMAYRTTVYDLHTIGKQLEDAGWEKETKVFLPKTFVFNFGKEKWNAPKSLAELIINPEEHSINNRYLLIDIHDLDHTMVSHLRTDLQNVLELLEKKDDKDAMENYVYEHEDIFRNIAMDTMVFLNEAAEFKFTLDQEQEAFDMCKAFEQIKQESMEQGIEQGTAHTKEMIIMNMLAKNMDLQLISDVTGVSYSHVEMLKNKKFSA